MPDRHSLIETEQATQERVGHLALDFAASHATLSLYRAANAVRARLTNQVLRKHDLTWTGFLVLWTLWIWHDMETRDVAESVGISKGTLTGVAKTLLGQGLIERTQNADDRRFVTLALSPQGVELMTSIYPEFNSLESDIVAAVDPDELTTMTRALRALVTASESE